MTKVIGLTGGIGSGKTTVAKLFMSEGIPVYIADDQAKKIMESRETVREIASVFGEEVVKNDRIDTKALSSIVFNNPDKLTALNAIVHPLVRQDFDQWVAKNKSFPFVIKEAA